MPGIYHNASLTIVLASALDDSTKGLQGISGPRNLGQETFELTEEHTLVQHLSMKWDRRTDPWSKRAWTFQEGLFSRRILEFQNETVFWRCRQVERSEDVAYVEDDDSDVSDEYEVHDLRQNLVKNFPSFQSIGRLINAYNVRDLTYVEDAHTAFSSILAVLGHSFKNGFISGLPAINLDLALLWLPSSPMIMRADEQYNGSMLPSWSWIAWQGELDHVCWYKGHDHMVMTGKPWSASERILPLVHWSIPESNDSVSQSLPNEWLSMRQKYMTEDVIPPKGWTRHAYNAFDMNPYDEEGNEEDWIFDPEEDGISDLNRPEMGDRDSLPSRYYTHESTSRAKFWYPIPLPDRDEAIPEPVVVTHICCETRLARLYGAERIFNDRRDHGAITLRDESGRFAGALRPNQWSPMLAKGELANRDRHNLFGTCFSLVELSLGYCYEDYWEEYPRTEPNIDEWNHPERLRDSSKRYEFYNVMWVIWRDGIAYRRGIGHAEKTVWELLKREHISLTLG